MIHVGFTGTRHGMRPSQQRAVDCLLELLTNLGPLVAHHGDCIGADAQFHKLALDRGASIWIHPPIDDTHRAYCGAYNVLRAPLTHFARNRAIVSDATVMIATPFEAEPQQRGGTWYTIGQAMKSGKPLAIVRPHVGRLEGATVDYFGALWPRTASEVPA